MQRFSTRKVLLVGIDPVGETLFRTLFKELKVTITSATNSNEALILLMQKPFDLIINGMAPMDKNNLQFLQLVRHWRKKTPLIILKGDEDTDGLSFFDTDEIISGSLKWPFEREAFFNLIRKNLHFPEEECAI